MLFGKNAALHHSGGGAGGGAGGGGVEEIAHATKRGKNLVTSA